ncbi:hypothetical protein ACWKWC_04860 [Geodermatophilus nigrescens]
MSQDVSAGRSVVVVVPAHVVDDGSVRALVEAIERSTGAYDCPPPDEGTDLPGAVARLFGPPEAWRHSADPWRDLVRWPAWHGQPVLLRSWEHDLSVPLRRLPALLQEAGVAESERPVLIMVVCRRDVDERRLDHVDALTTGVHWWWGVLDRLDTEAFLAGGERRTDRDVLRRSVLAEVSAWSLELAAHLSSGWNGRVDQLHAAIQDFAGGEPVPAPPPAATAKRSSFPVAADRDAWDAGQVEQWDGRRRTVPWQVDDRRSLDTLVWRAQNRVLMPRVDEARAELEACFRRRASQSVVAEVSGRGDVLELGPMRWALGAFGVRLEPEDARRLRVLCELRNRLAHGSPADDALIASARPHLHT